MGSARPAWHEAVFVNGEFRRPAGGGTIGVRDKASGEIFATSGLAGEADVTEAVAAATAAQPAWAERTYAERAGLLRDAAALLADRAKPLRELIMRETGCGVGQSGLGGRSGGDANIEEFTERRWLTVNPAPRTIRTDHSGPAQRCTRSHQRHQAPLAHQRHSGGQFSQSRHPAHSPDTYAVCKGE